MKDNRKIYLVVGILFIIASFCFIIGTVNHILNTDEGIVSSILLAVGCSCFAVVFLGRARKN